MAVIPASGAGRFAPMVVAGLAAIVAHSAHGQTNTHETRPAIDIVNPMEVDGHSMDGPLAQHHAVFTREKHHTRHMQLGYNYYSAGFRVDSAYAFKVDGLCYIASGELELSSDGVVVKATPRTIMWRPAGAMTEVVEAVQDSVSVCANSPPREEGSLAKPGEGEVGRWTGDVALQPRVRFYSVDYIRPEARLIVDGADVLVAERRIVSLRKDGSAKVDFTHFDLKLGARLRDGGDKGEQMCWLESGQLEVASAGKTAPMTVKSFLFRPEGAAIDEVRALKDSSLVCWSAPARP